LVADEKLRSNDFFGQSLNTAYTFAMLCGPMILDDGVSSASVEDSSIDEVMELRQRLWLVCVPARYMWRCEVLRTW